MGYNGWLWDKSNIYRIFIGVIETRTLIFIFHGNLKLKPHPIKYNSGYFIGWIIISNGMKSYMIIENIKHGMTI